MPSPQTLALIEKAKAAHAARQAEKAAAIAAAANMVTSPQGSPAGQPAVTVLIPTPQTGTPQTVTNTGSTALLNFNPEQLTAITMGIEGKSFALTGAAGTGKTTVTQELISRLQQCSHVSPIAKNTKWLTANTPGIVICGFTNKAVNNIRRRLPLTMKSHCITIHKLIEYAPTPVTIQTENGPQESMRFLPTFNANNKLPHISTIIFEESSMIGTDLYGEVIAALPNPERTQMIFLGDLNQLKPVFGHSIFGFKMSTLPVIELTHVYRQALLSPIIALATAIRTNSTGSDFDTNWKGDIHLGGNKSMTLPKKLTEKVTINTEHGNLVIQPWKKRVPQESVVPALANLWPKMMKEGEYNPEADMILCPFNKSFGTIEINKQIADHLGRQRGAEVFEIIARGQKQYYAVGDRVLVDKMEGTITKITRNYAYLGRPPVASSPTLDRWGFDPNNDETNINEAIESGADNLLAALENLNFDGDDDSGTNKASHIIQVFIPEEDKTIECITAGEVNNMLFSYALTVHKSQGSEWERVIVMLHGSHATMLSRELLYTAATRAKKELIIFCEGDGKYDNQIKAAAERPDIPGTTLADKIAYFTEKGKSMKV